MMIIPVKTAHSAYDILLERGCLAKVGEHLPLQNRRTLIVTDSGVPTSYAATVAAACSEPYVVTIPQGEQSKQMDTLQRLLASMVEHCFNRHDCVIAVGGGVVGDLAGFAASVYMRGVDFYNIPTTLLSQVDSSIGGKTAVDFMGLKNIVGAFYPPKKVLIDPDTLSTLPPRQLANGLAESVKMALTHDADLFALLEQSDLQDPVVLENAIARSLRIKRQVVQDDERETGLRMVLNFGHTLAHAVESVCQMDTYFHGECVAMGMVPMCSPAVRERLIPVLKKLSLPTDLPVDAATLMDACRHDKKAVGQKVMAVFVPTIGMYEITPVSFEELEQRICEVNEK